jgi:two-component system, OmpR family, KDP operon response regulator KdpE
VAKKILVIEDDADIRTLLKAQLGSAGYDTAFAWDAVTALTVARKEAPDLILLDLGLPGGDGWVVMERLQTLAPFAMIPIIVVSAQPTDPNAERATAAGAHAFIEKPYEVETVLAAVHDALGD